MVPGRGQTSGDEQRAELVAVKAGGVRLVVKTRTADMDRRRVVDETFLFGIAIQTGDRAQPPGQRGPGLSFGFEMTGEALDVAPPSREQPEVMVATPAVRNLIRRVAELETREGSVAAAPPKPRFSNVRSKTSK